MRAFLSMVPSMPRKAKVILVEEPTSTCKDCRAVDFGEVITCHRFPPKPAFDASGEHVDTFFPVVRVTDWCLEFKPKLSS
jgi:hypothetical protein